VRGFLLLLLLLWLRRRRVVPVEVRETAAETEGFAAERAPLSVPFAVARLLLVMRMVATRMMSVAMIVVSVIMMMRMRMRMTLMGVGTVTMTMVVLLLVLLGLVVVVVVALAIVVMPLPSHAVAEWCRRGSVGRYRRWRIRAINVVVARRHDGSPRQLHPHCRRGRRRHGTLSGPTEPDIVGIVTQGGYRDRGGGTEVIMNTRRRVGMRVGYAKRVTR
jgi:hypothetical protein